jgi:hypothetical protein
VANGERAHPRTRAVPAPFALARPVVDPVPLACARIGWAGGGVAVALGISDVAVTVGVGCVVGA